MSQNPKHKHMSLTTTLLWSPDPGADFHGGRSAPGPPRAGPSPAAKVGKLCGLSGPVRMRSAGAMFLIFKTYTCMILTSHPIPPCFLLFPTRETERQQRRHASLACCEAGVHRRRARSSWSWGRIWMHQSRTPIRHGHVNFFVGIYPKLSYNRGACALPPRTTRRTLMRVRSVI